MIRTLPECNPQGFTGFSRAYAFELFPDVAIRLADTHGVFSVLKNGRTETLSLDPQRIFYLVRSFIDDLHHRVGLIRHFNLGQVAVGRATVIVVLIDGDGPAVVLAVGGGLGWIRAALPAFKGDLTALGVDFDDTIARSAVVNDGRFEARQARTGGRVNRDFILEAILKLPRIGRAPGQGLMVSRKGRPPAAGKNVVEGWAGEREARVVVGVHPIADHRADVLVARQVQRVGAADDVHGPVALAVGPAVGIHVAGRVVAGDVLPQGWNRQGGYGRVARGVLGSVARVQKFVCESRIFMRAPCFQSAAHSCKNFSCRGPSSSAWGALR